MSVIGEALFPICHLRLPYLSLYVSLSLFLSLSDVLGGLFFVIVAFADYLCPIYHCLKVSREVDISRTLYGAHMSAVRFPC